MKRTKEQLKKHLRTHSARSVDDREAVGVLGSFLISRGRINCEFACNDTWPNIDGHFELVPNPNASRHPIQNFVVQIKGTNHATITKDGNVKYQLKSLAFPAYVASEVTLDPSILFVVINAGKIGEERVFYKYISSAFLSSIDFEKGSTTIEFTNEDEIMKTQESIDDFVNKLEQISENHSFMKQLENQEFDELDIKAIITARCNGISDAIETGNILNQTRDNISRKILIELEDLCKATLLLNGIRYYNPIGLRAAWEFSLMNIDTKFLSTFLQGLRYIGIRVPQDGQYERLILKYYGFLWKIRKFLKEQHSMNVLSNLEEFPLEVNDEDKEYNKIVAVAIDAVTNCDNPLRPSRYYIQKKTPFYVGTERYFEITLQLADKYATKFNRLTVYTKIDMSSNYSIQVGFEETDIKLWESPSKIKVVTNWRVSIEPTSLNKFAMIFGKEVKMSSRYGEYVSLMEFLTKTGMNLLDLIDMRDDTFTWHISNIYDKQNTNNFKQILIILHKRYNNNSNTYGRNVIRYALLRLKEDLLEDLLAKEGEREFYNRNLHLTNRCYPFENNPILYNLPNKKTNTKTISKDVIRVVGTTLANKYGTYIRIKHLIDRTGEVYFPKEEIECQEISQTIQQYNTNLKDWDKRQGLEIIEKDGYVYIDEYVTKTVYILEKLLEFSQDGNFGQEALNQNFIQGIDDSTDESKIRALENVFVNSKIIMIYGAAGTGKTTLMNYISNLMEGRSKLFLTKTHTALENLKRRIQAPGQASEFIGIDKFIRSRRQCDCDIVFVDECSTIDNRTMAELMNRVNEGTLMVFAGDIYQIESIDFGNWFFYAKDILPETSVVELNSTWRTQAENIKSLWEEVRYKRALITEKLVIDGPFSENINKILLEISDEDEVVLCLNYDGKFGLNSINKYFQDANPSTKECFWYDWKYKVGDPILFNENKRFPKLYNNLKGRIVNIQQDEKSICFTIDVETFLTSIDARNSDLEIMNTTERSTRIRFSVYENDGGTTDEEREQARMKSIVPFQLAYAVSIHKAQGLEYNSVKIVIPSSNSEKISHGIFYTAITRTKEKLKIYWSADTMKKIIDSFNDTDINRVSLDFIKNRLFENNV